MHLRQIGMDAPLQSIVLRPPPIAGQPCRRESTAIGIEADACASNAFTKQP
jgi:hypothetical protein